MKQSAVRWLTGMIVAVGLSGLAGCGGGGSDNPNAEQDLTHLGMMYHTYWDAHAGKPPSKADDLQEFTGDPKDKQAYEALKAGKYEIIWNVRFLDVDKTPAGTDGTVLGWEKDAPTKGGRVLFVNTSTKKLSADEFKAAPQAKPKS